LSPRKPIRTTAADCEIRGGEYVSFDRADYRTALKVWMEAAKAGDAEAQTNVGEIFEKGLGTEPNYEAAHLWYRRAAEQGYTRAQFNLGTLYEMGLGVPADKSAALNWYRQAWGAAADELIFASAAAEERAELEARLATAITEKESQIQALKAQVQTLENQLKQASAATDAEAATARAQAKTLSNLIAQLESAQQKDRGELLLIGKSQPPKPIGSSKLRSPLTEVIASQNPAAQAIQTRSYRNLNLGRYFALLIGNQNYDSLESLETPLNDIRRAKQILEERYGFTVVTIEDSDNVSLMEAINDLYEILGEEDNLLLFYAGHGNRLTTGPREIGYWLPANANPPPRDTYWVSNEFVSGHLSRLKARRILVVADSCYAGLLSSEPTFLLLGDNAPDYNDPEFLSFKLNKRARLLLSSGGDRPVLDNDGAGHSVFARAFLDELERNDTLLPAPELFVRIRDRVKALAATQTFEQKPDFKTIKSAGHEIGDFFFVPTSAL
jgi:uncharacterized protein